MERQEAMEGFLKGVAAINESITRQLLLFPKITSNVEAIKTSILKLQAERQAQEAKTKSPLSKEEETKSDESIRKSYGNETDRLIERARRIMTDPVIRNTKDYGEYREDSTREYGWNFLDPSWWYFPEQHPGQPHIEDSFHPPYMFHPRSYGIQFWNGIYNIFIIVVVLVVPYDLGASVPIHWLWFASLLASTATAVDIYVRARTAMDTRNGLITDPATVIKMQLSSGKLFIDFLIGFPWIIIAQFQLHFHVIMLFHMLCVFRLWDARDIFFCFSITKMARRYSISNMTVKLMQVYGLQILYWHWATCANILYGIKSNERLPFAVYSDHFERIASRQYDYQDLTVFQHYMNMIFVSIGCAFDVIFLTVLESYLTHLNGAGQNFQERIDQLHHYSDYKGFGTVFRNKMLLHYEHKYPDGQYCIRYLPS
jgi:hypothetical protein